MSRLRAGLILLLIQLALILSIAGKYLYERQTRPRVWVRATQYDPNTPLRGRYLALKFLVDACAMPHDAAHHDKSYRVLQTGAYVQGGWHWTVSVEAVGGQLVPRLAESPSRPENTFDIKFRQDRPCDRAPLDDQEELFISDRAKTPFPLQTGQELWVEVTVPKQGPPRPIQLALSDASGFHPLKLN